MNMLNIDLLDRTLDYIEKNPEQHDQGVWRCGTDRCFAGWACALDGAVAAIPEDTLPYWATDWRSNRDGKRTREEFIRFYAEAGYSKDRAAEYADSMVDNRDTTIILSDQEKTDILTYATRALGLDSRSADLLFGGENELETLQEMVQHLREEGTLIGSEWDDEDGDYCCEGCNGY